ncbi:MAG TPA: hypothetical protein VM581_02660 [Magnetospirillaceae bacterium]|nr:hypothetical protein [Magnetospirillaceae bacterium]
MSDVRDVWENNLGEKLVQAVCDAASGTFITVYIARPEGQRIAGMTTYSDEGYNPCWQTTTRLAFGARAGADIIGLTSSFMADYPKEAEESPRSDGVGMRLFRDKMVVGVIGLLGLPAAEAVALIAITAQKFGLVTAELRT